MAVPPVLTYPQIGNMVLVILLSTPLTSSQQYIIFSVKELGNSVFESFSIFTNYSL